MAGLSPLRLANGSEWVRGRRPGVMGILNVTPDSFSDGGRHASVEAAVARAWAMRDAGADFVDVGGESTRPGAHAVDPAEEQRRVLPVLDALRDAAFDVPVSIDTRHGATADAALRRGAALVNDVSALSDREMVGALTSHGAPVVLMHMQGTPACMQQDPQYGDVVAEVCGGLRLARDRAVAAGVPATQIVLDPGIGFGKRTGAGVEDNCSLLSGLPRLRALGHLVLVGASRKRFIGSLTGAAVENRLPGSLVAAVAASWGGADMVRVHDVGATVQALDVAQAIDPALWG